MRLVCPNCGATYEVPAEVIPDGGRDVQCSNCNNTWFQLPAGAQPIENTESELTASVEEPTINVPEQPELAPEPEPQMAPTMSSEAESILRQEAEFSQQIRDAEAGSLETQPDLGLEASETPREADIRERLSKVKDLEPESIAAAGAGAVAAAAGAASRRDLLPDIEEINSTLSGNEKNQPEISEKGSHDAEQADRKKRRGFRRGFLSVLLIFAILIALYLFAQNIKDLVPASAAVLDPYVTMVDSFRLWLDGVLTKIGTWANALMEKATEAMSGSQSPDTEAPVTTE